MSSETDLTGKLLIAMPGMGDPRFAHSVVLMCAYSPEGAMGLIINKLAPGVALQTLMDQQTPPRARTTAVLQPTCNPTLTSWGCD